MSRAGGFTLIELMIAFSLIAILSVIGLPSFQNFIAQNRLTGTSNQLLGSLQMARSEAVKRAINIELAPSNDGWANGWNIHVPGGDVIRVFDSVPSSISISGGNMVFTAGGSATSAECYEVVAVGINATRYIEVIGSGFATVVADDCND